MENNTFLVFLFAILIGILFIGSGVTGLYSIDIEDVTYCDNKSDCDSGNVCCAFREGGYTSRICAKDCRGVRSLSQEVNNNEQTANGFVFEITGRGIQEFKGNIDYWVYILIGVVLVLLALFYKKGLKQVVIGKKVAKKRRKKRKR